jgi:cobalt-zinc-cadmium efflux system outer membrane protein
MSNRITLILLLLGLGGCHAPEATLPFQVEVQVAAVAPVRAVLGPARPAGQAGPVEELPVDLPGLWRLAAAYNPSLREAAADVEAARGQQIQAGKYPNPHFAYAEDLIGSRAAPSGNLTLQITQEIVTAGKRQLDVAIASRETSAACLGLMSRKFEVMTRLRRAYYGYLSAAATVQVNEEAVLSLQKGVNTTRKLVETVQIRPKTDLLRLEALLEETQINLARSRLATEAAWKQVAAEVGLPDLPQPNANRGFQSTSPQWESDGILQRVKAANSTLQQAFTEVDRARLAVDRARAEAIPNLTVGGGYANAPIESTAGAVITLETPLPIWDLKQGHVRDAQARLVKAQAAACTLENNLSSTTAEALARYQGASLQVQRLSHEVLPRLQESVNLLFTSYELGGATVTFADVLTTEQSLIETRLKLVEARQTMCQAMADLQGLMQLDIDEDYWTPR